MADEEFPEEDYEEEPEYFPEEEMMDEEEVPVEVSPDMPNPTEQAYAEAELAAKAIKAEQVPQSESVQSAKNKQLKSMIKDLKAKTAAKQKLTVDAGQTGFYGTVPEPPPVDTGWSEITTEYTPPKKITKASIFESDVAFTPEPQTFSVIIEDVWVDYEVKDPTKEVTPVCKSFVPSASLLKSTDGLPTDWKFDGTFNHPICTNEEAIVAHETKVCSYANNFGGCGYFDPIMPVPVKQFIYDEHEVFILAEMRSKFGNNEHVIFKKDTLSSYYSTYRISTTFSSALDVWDELVTSYGATVEDIEVPVTEKISFLAGMVA